MIDIIALQQELQINGWRYDGADTGENALQSAISLSSPLLPQQGGGTTEIASAAQAFIECATEHRNTDFSELSHELETKFDRTRAVLQKAISSAAVLPQVGAPRLSDVQIDNIRNTVMIQLATENAGVIGGPDVEDMKSQNASPKPS